MTRVYLKRNFDTGNYTPGASKFKLGVWHITSVLFFRSKLIPSSSLLISVLRLFGAKIGKDVRIKPGVEIKFPWRLKIGDNSWVAECYIENLDYVTIGNNCCISQKVTLITGNHNYKSENFDLIVKPIQIFDGAWIGAGSIIGPGVVVNTDAVLSVGSVATKDLAANTVYQGNPAKPIRERFKFSS